MIIKLILAAAILYLLFSGFSRYKKLKKPEQKKLLLRAAFFAVVALLLLGALTGRMHWIGAIFAALLPLLRFGAGAAFKLLPFWLGRGGEIPFKTEYLDVKVQLKSGLVSGTICKGEFQGRPLGSLNTDELDTFRSHCQEHDVKAYYLLRFLGNTSQQNTPPPEFDNPQIDEALETLGLQGKPSKEDILKAHKKLIHKLHPDRGGSDFLAARVNLARDVLLKHFYP